MCSRINQIFGVKGVKVKGLTTTELLLLIIMMMAMTKTMGITKITTKKKKLNFNYASARLIYSHLPVSVKQFTRFIK